MKKILTTLGLIVLAQSCFADAYQADKYFSVGSTCYVKMCNSSGCHNKELSCRSEAYQQGLLGQAISDALLGMITPRQGYILYCNANKIPVQLTQAEQQWLAKCPNDLKSAAKMPTDKGWQAQGGDPLVKAYFEGTEKAYNDILYSNEVGRGHSSKTQDAGNSVTSVSQQGISSSRPKAQQPKETVGNTHKDYEKPTMYGVDGKAMTYTKKVYDESIEKGWDVIWVTLVVGDDNQAYLKSITGTKEIAISILPITEEIFSYISTNGYYPDILSVRGQAILYMGDPKTGKDVQCLQTKNKTANNVLFDIAGEMFKQLYKDKVLKGKGSNCIIVISVLDIKNDK